MDIYSLYIATRLKKKYKAKLIFDSREIYSALSTLSKRKIAQYLLTRYEIYLVKYVDSITVSGELDKAFLQNHFRKNNEIEIIMNLPPRKEIENLDLIRKKFNITEKYKILIYQGMILPGRGLEKIIISLQFLDNIVLCIFGDGSYKSAIEQLISAMNLESKVIFCGEVPYEELHKWTCSADIGVVIIEPISFSYELALPNKLFEYCMAGRPVLMSNLKAMQKIHDEFKIGEVLDFNSTPQSIANLLKLIFKNYEYYKSQAISASQKYHYESQIHIIKKVYNL